MEVTLPRTLEQGGLKTPEHPSSTPRPPTRVVAGAHRSLKSLTTVLAASISSQWIAFLMERLLRVLEPWPMTCQALHAGLSPSCAPELLALGPLAPLVAWNARKTWSPWTTWDQGLSMSTPPATTTLHPANVGKHERAATEPPQSDRRCLGLAARSRCLRSRAWAARTGLDRRNSHVVLCWGSRQHGSGSVEPGPAARRRRGEPARNFSAPAPTKEIWKLCSPESSWTVREPDGLLGVRAASANLLQPPAWTDNSARSRSSWPSTVEVVINLSSSHLV